MKRHWLLGAVVLVGVGCDVVLGIEEGIPQPACTMDAECRVDYPECASPWCNAGRCDIKPVLRGKRLSVQHPNDCKLAQCGAEGKPEEIPFDDAEDGNPCTKERCIDGVVSLTEKLSGTSIPCYLGAPETRNVGVCREGTVDCDDGQPTKNCENEVRPMTEICDNGEDEDCNGAPETEFDGCVCGDGVLTPEKNGEECDDGTVADGDNCSPICKKQEVLQVVAGNNHTCALLSGNVVKCWGAHILGILGLGVLDRWPGANKGDMGANLPPVDLGSQTIKSIAAGGAHTCAIIDDDKLKCWGYNSSGQLGLGDKHNRGDDNNEMGTKLPFTDLGGNVEEVALGGEHSCARLDDGVKCWGLGHVGQLGSGSSTNSLGDGPGEMGVNLPYVDLGGKAIAIAAGYFHNCAVLSDGRVKCWGFNDFGQLGLGDQTPRGWAPNQMGDALPAVDLEGKAAKAVVATAYSSCALLVDGTVKCWGKNDDCQLGAGKNDPWIGTLPEHLGANLKPVDLGQGERATRIFSNAPSFSVCVQLESGGFKCWGSNKYGQLGQGDTTSRGCAPGEIAALPLLNLGAAHTISAISAMSQHICATLSSGAIKCWGWNEQGQLGLEDMTNRGGNPGEMGDNLPTVKLFSNAW